MNDSTRALVNQIQLLLAPLGVTECRAVLDELRCMHGETAPGHVVVHPSVLDELHNARRLLMAAPGETVPEAIIRVLSRSAKVEP